MITRPKYVNLVMGAHTTALRLTDKDTYYRDAGNWEVEATEVNGKLVAKSDDGRLKHVNGLPLIEVARWVWEESNRGYVRS